jgi:hypothetical protein
MALTLRCVILSSSWAPTCEKMKSVEMLTLVGGSYFVGFVNHNGGVAGV